ncbi:MAG: DUF2171 domain-containing protein [Chloroflexota bacterium]|nr:DUF2171 domain-containing protein [Chloroflexota bacterium]MDQ6908083.1 DUF2171 domain-containing protein [Chloroflexota bacterium]
MENTTTGNIGKVAISEGAEVYGSDGKQWGRVEAVGAKYLTIAEGLLGQREYFLPISFVSCGDADRVELNVPLVDAKAQALTEAPEDEPIFGESVPVPPEEMEAVGIPEPERAEVGTGEDREETERVRQVKGMG